MSRTRMPVMRCAIVDSSPPHASIAPAKPSMTAATKLPDDLRQRWPLPSTPRPIVVIGAGSIVRDAHLPVYRRLGFPVTGIFDLNSAASNDKARAFAIARVFRSLDEAAATPGAIFDVAIPPENIAAVLERLPIGSA